MSFIGRFSLALVGLRQADMLSDNALCSLVTVQFNPFRLKLSV